MAHPLEKQDEIELLRAIIEIQRQIAEAEVGLKEAMQMIVERLQWLTQASAAIILIREKDELVIRASAGVTKSPFGTRLNIYSSFSGRCLLSERTLTCADTETDPAVDREVARRIGARSVVATPLWQRNLAVGIVGIIFSRPNAFRERDIQAMELIAGFIGGALNRAADLDSIRHQEELLRQFVLNVPVPIAMLDKNMNYIMASKRWLTDYRLDENEIIGKCHYDVFPEIPERWREVHKRVLQGEVLKCDEDCFIRKDGNVDWLRWELYPWYETNGEVGGMAMFTEVITDRKCAEDELRRSNQELAQFASVVSHDLQEPARIIVSYLQLLKRRSLPFLDVESQRFIEYAVSSGKRMVEIIQALLQYCQLTSPTAKVEACDATDVLEKTLVTLGPLLQERNAVTECDKLPSVYIAAASLGIVFQNLILNAVRFCKNQPRIHIGCERHSELTVFYVKDNGIGIDPAHFERIFQMFQRLHTREEFPGIGLGLASCKKIIEQAGGEIWVQSAPGQGSTFFFSLRSA